MPFRQRLATRTAEALVDRGPIPMRRSFVVRSLAATTVALMALVTAEAAIGSDYEQPTAVSATGAPWTPNLVEVAGSDKPVAYSIAEAGNQMVVGGRFAARREREADGAVRAFQRVRLLRDHRRGEPGLRSRGQR